MGNKLARTAQVSASEYYLDGLPSSYNVVLKEALGGGRDRQYLFPVTRNFSRPNKIIDNVRGDKESRDVKSSGVVSIKVETVPARSISRNEGQLEGMREAMAAFMKRDNKDPEVTSELRTKKVKFRDQVGTSAQSIIRSAESLIADSSVNVR
jgi:hypothetical protein